MDFFVGTFKLTKRVRDLNTFELQVRFEDGRSISSHLEPSK